MTATHKLVPSGQYTPRDAFKWALSGLGGALSILETQQANTPLEDEGLLEVCKDMALRLDRLYRGMHKSCQSEKT